jgi:hypothetical protein
MTGRGELLELIDRAPGPLRTLQGHWETWAHLGRSDAAQEKAYGEPRIRWSAGFADPATAIRKGWQDIWFVAPDRWRVVSDGPPLRFETLDISDGVTRWVGSEEVLRANEWRMTGYDRASDTVRISDPPLADTLYPGAMLGWLQLGDPIASEHEGRSVWMVRGQARRDPSGRKVPPELTFLPGAEHFYKVDAETGIVLRYEAAVDGEVCLRSGLTGVVVDEPIDPELFRPPEQAEVQTATDQELATLEAHGVDTTKIDRTDAQAVRAAYHVWRQSLNQAGEPPRFRPGRPRDPGSSPPE